MKNIPNLQSLLTKHPANRRQFIANAGKTLLAASALGGIQSFASGGHSANPGKIAKADTIPVKLPRSIIRRSPKCRRRRRRCRPINGSVMPSWASAT